MQQRDLFDEPHVSIPDNSVLERAANRLLLMYQRDKTLFDGSTIGEIDRRIFAEILWEDGIHSLIPSDKKEDFIKVIKSCPESDVITRARRWLVEHDEIRLSASVIRQGEQMRTRIGQSLHK